MAICKFCMQEMINENMVTCEGNKVIDFPDSTEMPAIPYLSNRYRCSDCGVKNAGNHHPNCDMERCPKCGGQLISCGCLDDV